jgi:hypothetical protein
MTQVPHRVMITKKVCLAKRGDNIFDAYRQELCHDRFEKAGPETVRVQTDIILIHNQQKILNKRYLSQSWLSWLLSYFSSVLSIFPMYHFYDAEMMN